MNDLPEEPRHIIKEINRLAEAAGEKVTSLGLSLTAPESVLDQARQKNLQEAEIADLISRFQKIAELKAHLEATKAATKSTREGEEKA